MSSIHTRHWYEEHKKMYGQNRKEQLLWHTEHLETRLLTITTKRRSQSEETAILYISLRRTVQQRKLRLRFV